MGDFFNLLKIKQKEILKVQLFERIKIYRCFVLTKKRAVKKT